MERKLIKNWRYDLKFDYYVYENGTIYSDKSKKFLSPQKDKDGYLKVQMISTDNKRHRYSVHRLVMENFCPVENMKILQVNHIDGNKENNALSNLEWVTCKQNIQHAINNNLRAEINGASKLTKEQVLEIIDKLQKGYPQFLLGQEYGVHEETIGRIKRHKSWKFLTKDINFN